MAQLFVRNGEPLKFAMRRSPEREKLQSLIIRGGGIVVSKATCDTYLLAIPGAKVLNDQCISINYVFDCVNANKLLDPEDYKAITNVPSESTEDSNEDISDIEEHQIDKNKWKTMRSPQRMYTLHEDQKIIDYISKRGRIKAWKGNKMWQEFQDSVNINRSWQSMKERFKKHILKNLTSYNVPPALLEYYEKHVKKSSRKRRHLRQYASQSSTISPLVIRTTRVDTSASNREESTQNNLNKDNPKSDKNIRMFSSDEEDDDTNDDNLRLVSSTDEDSIGTTYDENAILELYSHLPPDPTKCNEDNDNIIIQILQHIFGVNEAEIRTLLIHTCFDLRSLCRLWMKTQNNDVKKTNTNLQ